jgi:hypothetical protein
MQIQASSDGLLLWFAGTGRAQHRGCLLIAACCGVTDGDLSAIEHACADPLVPAEALASFLSQAGDSEGVAGAEQHRP